MRATIYILYFSAMVLLLCCTTNTTPPTSNNDTLVSKASLTASTSLSSTVKLTSTMASQVNALIAADRASQAKDISAALTKQLTTINLDNAPRDQKITDVSLLAQSLQKTLIATQDTLNAYKRIADGNVFEIKNGVWTVQRYQEVIAAMIKAGLLK